MLVADAVEDAVAVLKKQPADPDNTLSVLTMYYAKRTPDGNPASDVIIVGLALDSGKKISLAANGLIMTCEPEVAVICLPSINSALPQGKTLEDFGETRVSELPLDMQQYTIVILGEDALGNSDHKILVLERDSDGNHIWADRADNSIEYSVFQPLFAWEDILRNQKDKILELARIAGVPEDLAIPLARKQFAQMLANAII